MLLSISVSKGSASVKVPEEGMQLSALSRSRESVQTFWLNGDDSHSQRPKRPTTFVSGKEGGVTEFYSETGDYVEQQTVNLKREKVCSPWICHS